MRHNHGQRGASGFNSTTAHTNQKNFASTTSASYQSFSMGRSPRFMPSTLSPDFDLLSEATKKDYTASCKKFHDHWLARSFCGLAGPFWNCAFQVS